MITSSFSDPKFEVISENLKFIRQEMADAANKANRDISEIRLMAVTKTVPVEYINYSIEHCGVDLIGENKVQEFLSKKDNLILQGVEKHLIGHLQTNKVKKILPEVDMIQSVDSLRLAQSISNEASKLGRTSDILLEVNIGDEDSKTGFDKVAFFESLHQISDLSNIRVKGLMTIPPICDSDSEVEEYFDKMNGYFHEIKDMKLLNFELEILSMGMSGDYKQAILHGSNLVRIGSAIYGARIYK